MRERAVEPYASGDALEATRSVCRRLFADAAAVVAQPCWCTQGSSRVSVRSDVPPAPGAPTLTSVEMVNYDRDWAALNKDRILKLWQTTVGL